MSNSYRLRQLAFGLLVALFAFTLGSSANAQTSNYKRNVTFEDYTGTWCQYCPYGAWALDSMERRMGDNLVIFSWHAGDDLEFAGSTKLVADFKVNSFPTAIMNRLYSLGNYQWTENHPWYQAAKQQAALAPTVDVRITNVTIVGTKVDFDVETSPLDLRNMPTEDTSKYALFVALAEDAVVRDQQYIQGQMLTDFVHNNVGRYIFTGTLGDNFTMGTTTQVNTYPLKKHFSFTNVNGSWVQNNLRIKAFVTNTSNKTKYAYVQNAGQTAHLGELPETAPNAIWTVTPAEGAEVVADKPAKIIWSKQGTVGNAKIEYSINGGVNWNLVETNVTASPYLWTIPEPAIGQNVILRISDVGAANVTSTSETFSVIAPVPVTAEVIQPMAGEKLRPGQKYMVQFATSGEFGETAKLEYSTDGSIWKDIATVTNSATTYNWTVPSITAEAVQVRVSNANGVTGISGTFSIVPVGTLSALTVNSGNPVPQNSSVPVSWTASGDLGSKLKLEYSENGTTWSTLNSDINAGLTSYDWTTPDRYVQKAYLKLSSVEGPFVTAGPFAIGTQGTEAVKLEGMPKMNALAGSYPNPVVSTSSIIYHIAQAGKVQLVVRDIMGKDVVTLESGMHQPGAYSAELDATDLAAGTYVVTLLINGEAYSRTVSVTK
jgi:hypothetical protein